MGGLPYKTRPAMADDPAGSVHSGYTGGIAGLAIDQKWKPMVAVIARGAT